MGIMISVFSVGVEDGTWFLPIGIVIAIDDSLDRQISENGKTMSWCCSPLPFFDDLEEYPIII